MDVLTRLQALLADLFQLDTADLDFGLYRLLHIKRREVEGFIHEQLPASVRRAFGEMAEGEQAELRGELKDLAAQIRREVEGEDPFLPDGSLREEYRQLPIRSLREAMGRYDVVREGLQRVEATEAQQAEVFNHLYTFFRRYYEDGDFVPKRRYGTHETYAVPYDGEEVVLHWANKGQHYVKSGERLRDYAFTVETLGGPYRVRFTLAKATTPRENTKGETRFFFPQPTDATYSDGTFVLPFEYRLPTVDEVAQYGSNAKGQEALLQEALEAILTAVPEDALAVALRATVRETDKGEVSVLAHRLQHFTRKQTSDYFVHRDLKGFLSRELEFYIKDQVLHVADIEGDLAPKLRLLRVFRRVACDVIDFLDQLERVQCRLFEKKKFVLRTDYLCPVQHLPPELWPEVLANEAQQAAWRALFGVQGIVDEAFLLAHPTLVVDTGHFGEGFRLRLLGGFDDLEEATAGILVHGENHQALALLEGLLHKQVKGLFLDPPYNTGSDGFLYKDRVQHSSWLAMMAERMSAARRFMREDGVAFICCDDVEHARLRMLMDSLWGDTCFVASVAWEKRFTRSNNAHLVSSVKDNVLVYRASEALSYLREDRTDEANAIYSNPDDDPRGEWTSVSYVNPATKEARPNLVYDIWNPVLKQSVTHPTNAWKYSPDEHQRHVQENRLYWGREGGNTYPRLKRFLCEVGGMVPTDVWKYTDSGTTDEASTALKHMFGTNVFDNPKPVRLVTRVALIHHNQIPSQTGLYLDFFAGSGTTGQAVVELNRSDGGRRRFALIEMADYFGTVLVPRIQKVMYCPDWKDGVPVGYPEPSMDGMWPEWVSRTPRLVKVLRLEGYEDSLHNLVTEETITAEAPRAQAYQQAIGREAYRLHYLATLPLEASDTLLDVDRLDQPFAYTLEILTDEGPRTSPVDLVETFNLLYGLRVKRLQVWHNPADGDREYRVLSGKRGKEETLVIWRDMVDLDPAVERTFLEDRIEGYDRVLINGDSAVPGIESLDPLFKRLMEADAP